MTAAEWLAQVKARNTPSEIAPGTSSRDIVTFRAGELGFVMAGGWARASTDALVLASALEAVLACEEVLNAEVGHQVYEATETEPEECTDDCPACAIEAMYAAIAAHLDPS